MEQRAQRGQALILIALAFIGLAAFVGLAVDAGILFAAVGHLRRSVDAASLAAANQFREGRPVDALERSASEFIKPEQRQPGDSPYLHLRHHQSHARSRRSRPGAVSGGQRSLPKVRPG